MSDGRFFTQVEKELMLQRQEYMCGDCGEDLWGDHIGRNPAHHIVPVWAGGATEIENGVVLCHECHVKWDNLAIMGEFYPGEYTTTDIDDSQIRDEALFRRAHHTIATNRGNPQLKSKIEKATRRSIK